jgi:predicted SAM-dependent methyltransferase
VIKLPDPLPPTLVVGCGLRPKPGCLNLDSCRLPGVDVVHDLDRYPLPFPENSFERVEAEDVLEHVEDFIYVVGELWRVLKVGGVLWVRGPHCNYPEQVWADPTHRRAFAPRSFDNFDPSTYDGKHYGYYFGPARFRVMERLEKNKGMEFTLVKIL